MYGPTKCFMTIHVEVDANQKILDVHDSIDNLERKVHEQFGIDLTIHMDPIVIDNEVINDLRQRVKGAIKEIHPKLSMHDFRVVVGTTHINIIFDLVRPYKFEISDEAILRGLQEKIADDTTTYYFVIHFEHQFGELEDISEEY